MYQKKSKFITQVLFLIVIALFSAACNSNDKTASKEISQDISKEAVPIKQLSPEFKTYWYSGEAEITSYKLYQARYGEMREGTAVLIFVTEPFSAKKQTKADNNNPSNIPVLKLNTTKNYLTGIYPYSIMSSSFYPVYDNSHAIKLSFSSQEWCGQVYTQLNNCDAFEVVSHSYFENEADVTMQFDKNILEDELWNKIRINPKELPVGEQKMFPSLEYIRLSHKDLKAYNAILTLSTNALTTSYKIVYPDLKRKLKIDFNTGFPYEIIGWSETFESGFGANKKEMTSTATKIKSIKSPYWQKNSNQFLSLRDSLGL